MAASDRNLIEARELPYISRHPNDGRCIVAITHYDNIEDQFICYSAQPNGKLLLLRPISMVVGMYVAKLPADATRDYHLPFAEIVFQHFSLPNIWSLVEQLHHDLLNGVATIHKYFVILSHAKTVDSSLASSLISTELEYAIGNHRAFYDLLHKVVMAVNSTYHPHTQQLKDSFAKLVEKESDYLRNNLKLPDPIVQFYKTREDVFLLLRGIRDNIYHHGHTPDFIFTMDDGFAIALSDRFSGRLHRLNLWPDHLLKTNHLGSVLAALEFVVRDMCDAMVQLGQSLINSFVNLPAAVADGYRLYLRSPLGKHLYMLDEYRAKHWFDPDEILRETSKADAGPTKDGTNAT